MVSSSTIYPEKQIAVQNFSGITMNTALNGESSIILQRSFLTTYDPRHSKIIANLLSPFSENAGSLNALLVVIRDGIAKIYESFPLVLGIRAKREIMKFQVVRQSDVLDIESVQFRDDFFALDIKDGDKFLWFFRIQLNFGCYFDFSGKLKVNELYPQLGAAYRKLAYYLLYDALSSEKSFEKLSARGWFPFSQLIGETFDLLVSSSDADIKSVEETVLTQFDDARVDRFVQSWWRVPIFAKKRKLLESGVEAFNRRSDNDTIACIKILFSEIEGIVRLDFHDQYNRSPTTKELKEYLGQKALAKFTSEDSLGFPGLFFEYLNKVVFRNFDVEKGDTSLSRHSVNHGVAPVEEYSRIRALQLLLTLDQIHYYLG